MNISMSLKRLKKNCLKKRFIEFYSSLTNRRISDKEFDYVFTVWNKFEMKTMKDYHDAYLKRFVISR